MSVPIPHDILHKLAIACMPKLPIKERSTWVGILRHDKLDPEEIGEETDFVWLKCHGRITVKTLKHFYFTRSMVEDIRLQHKNYYPRFTMDVAELREREGAEDNIVVLRALEFEDTERFDETTRKVQHGQEIRGQGTSNNAFVIDDDDEDEPMATNEVVRQDTADATGDDKAGSDTDAKSPASSHTSVNEDYDETPRRAADKQRAISANSDSSDELQSAETGQDTEKTGHRIPNGHHIAAPKTSQARKRPHSEFVAVTDDVSEAQSNRNHTASPSPTEGNQYVQSEVDSDESSQQLLRDMAETAVSRTATPPGFGDASNGDYRNASSEMRRWSSPPHFDALAVDYDRTPAVSPGPAIKFESDESDFYEVERDNFNNQMDVDYSMNSNMQDSVSVPLHMQDPDGMPLHMTPEVQRSTLSVRIDSLPERLRSEMSGNVWQLCEYRGCRKRIHIKSWTQFGPAAQPLCTSHTYDMLYDARNDPALDIMLMQIETEKHQKEASQLQGHSQNMDHDEPVLQHWDRNPNAMFGYSPPILNPAAPGPPNTPQTASVSRPSLTELDALHVPEKLVNQPYPYPGIQQAEPASTRAAITPFSSFAPAPTPEPFHDSSYADDYLSLVDGDNLVAEVDANIGNSSRRREFTPFQDIEELGAVTEGEYSDAEPQEEDQHESSEDEEEPILIDAAAAPDAESDDDFVDDDSD